MRGLMMEQQTKRDKQVIRFLKWIRKYDGWWFLICTPGDEHMNLTMMKMLVNRLANEGFYEIIFVLLMVHRNEPFMDNIFKLLLLKMITENWDSAKFGKQEIIKEITDLLT